MRNNYSFVRFDDNGEFKNKAVKKDDINFLFFDPWRMLSRASSSRQPKLLS